MTRRDIDVLIIGSLIGFDLLFAEHLARRGVKVAVVRHATARDQTEITVPAEYFQAYDPTKIRGFHGPADLLALARRARLIASFGGAFGFAIGRRWLLRRVLGIPPVINFSTGSDFGELIVARSPLAETLRQFVRGCAYNVIHPYPHVIDNALTVGVPNILFLTYPYYYPVQPALPRRSPGSRLRLFHPSHLDWGVNDPGPQRNSTKGNDRFLRALLRAFDAGLDAECVILDRGPDRALARQMTTQSAHAARFTWRPHLSREDLGAEYASADVIVDQFDVGGLGGIALEAMALGRAVLAYLDPVCLDLLYDEHPPVISVRTEEEIYATLTDPNLPDAVRRCGEAGSRWMRTHYSWEKTVDPFLFYYALLTGHRLREYLPDRRSR